MSFRRGRANEGNTFLKNLPFGLAYTDVSSSQNSEFPQIPLPVNNPVSRSERKVAMVYINHTDGVKNGPFYTGAVGEASAGSSGESSGAVHDDGIERYSDRYLKKRKIGVSIDDHPFHLALFPKELYSVMGINKKKLLNIRKANSSGAALFTGEGDDNALGLNMLEKLKQLAEDVDDEDEKDENALRNRDDDISDNDYDEEEDEEDGNDYNAEAYFDNGEDDEYENGDDDGEAVL